MTDNDSGKKHSQYAGNASELYAITDFVKGSLWAIMKTADGSGFKNGPKSVRLRSEKREALRRHGREMLQVIRSCTLTDLEITPLWRARQDNEFQAFLRQAMCPRHKGACDRSE